ncbi:triacylglycerol lipase, partial [Oesophagostomum dentatum]
LLQLILNCPQLPDPAYAYNDTFARYYINPLIGALFLDSPEKCLKAQLPQVAYYKNILVKCAKEMPDVHCYGYTAWDPIEKAVIIVFIGAGSETQMLDVALSMHREKVAFFDDGHLIKYFNDAFFFLWDGGLEQQVRTLKYNYPGYKLYVTGHSMGASIATIAASYILKWGMWDPKDIRLITLGQPRTGDYDFADWHSAAVVQDNVHTPCRYDNDMAVGQPYTICPEADGDYCSNMADNNAGMEHLWYFDINVKEWGLNGCPSS